MTVKLLENIKEEIFFFGGMHAVEDFVGVHR